MLLQMTKPSCTIEVTSKQGKENEKAIKQLKQAMKNVDKAEENAFRNHKYIASEAFDKASLDIALICDNLRIANQMVMTRKAE